MPNTDKLKEVETYEIDIIELLGVVIRRRRLIIATTLLITALSGIIFYTKDQISPEVVTLQLDVNNAVFAEQDPIYALFNAMRPDAPLPVYKQYISKLLFPAQIHTPMLEVVRASDLPQTPSGHAVEHAEVLYAFYRNKDIEVFSTRFEKFQKNLLLLDEMRKSFDQNSFTRCVYYLRQQSNFPADGALFILDDISEAKKCNRWGAQYAAIQNILSSALGKEVNLNEETLSTIISNQLEHPERTKLRAFSSPGIQRSFFQVSKKSLELSSIPPTSEYIVIRHPSKSIRYAFKLMAFTFIPSTLLAIFLAFTMEFLTKNKTRFREFLGSTKHVQ